MRLSFKAFKKVWTFFTTNASEKNRPDEACSSLNARRRSQCTGLSLSMKYQQAYDPTEVKRKGYFFSRSHVSTHLGRSSALAVRVRDAAEDGGETRGARIDGEPECAVVSADEAGPEGDVLCAGWPAAESMGSAAGRAEANGAVERAGALTAEGAIERAAGGAAERADKGAGTPPIGDCRKQIKLS